MGGCHSRGKRQHPGQVPGYFLCPVQAFYHLVGAPMCSLHCTRSMAPHSRDGEMLRLATHPVRGCISKMQPETMGQHPEG